MAASEVFNNTAVKLKLKHIFRLGPFNEANEGQNITAKKERDDDGKINQPVVKEEKKIVRNPDRDLQH